jgi:YVTN family beta-propeller protein/autotransporter-associated beta strand protein
MKTLWTRAARDRRSSTALLGALLAAALIPEAVNAQSGPFVYVPNRGDDNVSVIDSPTNTVQPGTISAGNTATAVAVRGDQSLAYVANFNGASVSVIDTATNTVTATIAVGSGPAGIAITADGRRVYTANSGGGGTVSVIDTATNSVVATIDVGTVAQGVAVSPDGTRVYVSSSGQNNVSVINTATNTVVATIAVGIQPVGVAVSPDGTRAYVTNRADDNVSVINTATNTIVGTIAVGDGPQRVTFSPDGTRAYVANNNGNTVSVVNTATNTVVATIPVGTQPNGVAVSPDGTRAYVSNLASDNVSVIDATSNTVIATLAVGNGPSQPGACGNGNALLAAGLTFVAKQSSALACTGAGGPVFTGGTLQIASANIASSLPITLQSQGATVDTNGNNATLSGAISGPGDLTKIGAGTLTLSGSSSYSGATAVNAGTLQAGATNAFSSSSAFTVASGATLNLASFNQIIGSLAGAGSVTLGSATLTTGNDNTSTTFSGTISGTGGLIKIGSGTLVLSGVNTYSGGTTLAAGTLSLANNQALGTGALTTTGSIVDYANGVTIANPIVVNSNTTQLQVTTGTATQAAVISELNGPRPLEKIGGGTLVLTAANTYSGPTTITAGTLQLGNGGTSGSILGNVVNNAVFAVNRSDLFTFGGVISGTGAFQQNGTGATMLTAINTYSGPTSVNAGTLVVNGSIANSAVTVNAGATLAGIGTVGATTIKSGGTFAPGNSPGTITVQGNLAFQSGALYLVQVNPSTASSTNVTAGGSATLAGTVQAAFASGSYAARTYTILSAAGGLNGTTFNNLTTTNLPAGFTASLSYTATDAILNLTATLGQAGAATGPSALGTRGLSVNQLNVANSLNAFFNSGGTLPPAFVTIFGLTGGNLANALSQLSGEAATGAQKVGFQLTDQFLNLMLDPFVDGRSGVGGADHPALGFAPEREELPEDIALAYAKILKAPPKPAPLYEPRWTLWGAGFGGSNRTSGDLAVIGSHDLSARTAGGAAGLDYRITPDTVVGLALAGAGTDWSLSQGLGGGKSDAFQAGLYGATRWGPAYVAAAFAFANHWMSTDRFAFGDHLTADFNAQSYGGRLEGGYRFGTPYGGVTPYAAIQAQNFHTPGYTETGLLPNGFALSFNGRDATDTRSELGGRFDRVLAVYTNAVLALRSRIAWAHDWVSDPTLVPVFQTLPGASFIVNGALPVKDSALASAGAELRLANGVTLLAKFDGEFASRSNTYAGTGTIRYRW